MGKGRGVRLEVEKVAVDGGNGRARAGGQRWRCDWRLK